MTNSDSTQPEDTPDDLEVTNTSGYLRVAIEIAIAALILVGIYYIFAPEETIELAPPIDEAQIDPVIRDRIEAAKTDQSAEETLSGQPPVEEAPAATLPDEPQSSDMSALTSPPAAETAEPVTTAQSQTDARQMIAEIRRGDLVLSSTEIMEKSEQFSQQGRHTDTYLLLFYAAREGDGQAAFALASLYDPRHFQPGNALLEKADVFQAYKWYSKAAKQQVPDAQLRLETLRNEIEKQAEAGDPAARRLLLNWQ
ncbi:MAG: sel1 repeat family protein [Candidatus Thiodiazotropha lotti]|uniref:sel1 repeat family protein n=1 Tax=Candidatus Thiodiazotropha endoloripes TaxID=1818881 RepID=UPI00083DA356|nr:sel1 repeat family protein [Candidatus Thiodiazotropha endoloripes]MCG7914420.1 sel1 repeat family protein [Candidatus Thiodiazotropha weberae]MCG7989929.1 sel1 repeat family protein [Candidatus Thiodiazotropha lotti]MCG8001438.1 sel1 repeat family protein [Candidatus Thiodiazotropha lotti]MCW4181581.1 sel1 repeat family protein [Candidatus Thiodiazotropha weberae]MCW4193212.1 sel1 repeat family protein [Candidatus Thiodiazotropha weberae]